MAGGLSDDDKQFYDETGYLVLERVLDPATVAALNAEVDRIVAGAAGLTESDERYDLEESHTPEAPRVRRLKDPDLFYPTFRELISDPRLLDPAADLLGGSARLASTKLNMKAAGYGAPVEWHQDWAFYPHTNQDILALGLMLDDVTPENGPMMVLPGSHRGPVHDHHVDGVFCGAIDVRAAGIDLSAAVPLTGPAGSITLHHVRAVHGSALNRSGLSRRFLLYELCAVDAWPLKGIPHGDIAAYDARILRGKPTLTPRMAEVPVRMPYPPPKHQGSIYEANRGAAARYFEALDTPGTAAE